jgi:hypothetical protein
MIGFAQSLLRRIWRDTRGDAVQSVIISGLILIPLIMVLIFFGEQIAIWLKSAWAELVSDQKIMKSL